MQRVDVVVVGAGAAGLMAAVWVGRGGASVVALDGARKLGAKILVAGGGRCNVTHDEVEETAFAGSTPPAIRKVLRRFDVHDTVRFFAALGVELKREDTGKLFPVTDDAHTILDALLEAARRAGARLQHPARVLTVERADGGFRVAGSWGELQAARVVLATGGKALPKSGSDGFGYGIAQSLGHTVTRVFPALVPLRLAEASALRQLSGLSTRATLEVQSATGRRLASFTDSTLCTHFGLSGPSVLDVSRYYLDALAGDPGVRLVINWLPDSTAEDLDRELQALGRASPGRFLARRLPERLARALCAQVSVDPGAPGHSMTRERRRALSSAVCAQALPVTGDRGFQHAEVTAGGVPLAELRLGTMESRSCPGLYLCGELCDVDGRIGGYNFQWAWASGFVAGSAAARRDSEPR